MLYKKEDWKEIDPKNIVTGDIVWLVKVHPSPSIAWVITLKVYENKWGVIRGKILNVDQTDKTRATAIGHLESNLYKVRWDREYDQDTVAEFGIRVFAECPEHAKVLYQLGGESE